MARPSVNEGASIDEHRDALILERLRGADSPVSGSLLAGELGLSRVALWKRIETLKSRGYGIVASRRGYALTGDDGLAPGDFAPGTPLKLFGELPSTMDEARRSAQEGAPSGSMTLALRQSAGRGMGGASWSSPEGGLYLSLVLRSPLPPALSGVLLLEASSTLLELLDPGDGAGLRYRWPNGLVAGGRRVGGLLLEFQGGLDRADWYILGLGLAFPAILPSPSRPPLPPLPRPPLPRRRELAAAFASRMAAWAAAPRLASPAEAAAGIGRGRLLRDLPSRGRVLLWDGSTRDIEPLGFGPAGELLLRGAEALVPGTCRSIDFQGDTP